jgi:hypothetical protein
MRVTSQRSGFPRNQFPTRTVRVDASLIAGLLLVIAPHCAFGQPGRPETPSNKRLEIPEFPPLARQARIQVVQTVKVLLSNQATIENVEQSLQGKVIKLDRLFKESAEKALKNSRFSKTCGGKTITLVFHYEFRVDPNGPSLFAFRPPNHFWIRYGPV